LQTALGEAVQKRLLSIVLQNGATYTELTKEIPPTMTDTDRAIVVIRERIVVWFIAYKNVTTIICIYELGYLLLLLDSI
jgi:hypothetical protein